MMSVGPFQPLPFCYSVIKEGFRRPIKCHCSCSKTRWLAPLRALCNSFMVKALAQNPSYRSNLFHIPAMYEMVAGRPSPYTVLDEPRPLCGDNLFHYEEIENL